VIEAALDQVGPDGVVHKDSVGADCVHREPVDRRAGGSGGVGVHLLEVALCPTGRGQSAEASGEGDSRKCCRRANAWAGNA
jgi:hypothetical protein